MILAGACAQTHDGQPGASLGPGGEREQTLGVQWSECGASLCVSWGGQKSGRV